MKTLYLHCMAKLFIVGFPKDMKEIELVELFSVYGAVNTATIITDIETGASKGYGFITMTDDAGANRAIEALDGGSIDDRIISVRFADDKKQVVTPDRKTGDQRSPYRKNADPQRDTGLSPEKRRRPRR
ncbi:RNA recognition motif domain-containing protein [Mucilaginibacter agri]|uniref:RNA-binding protein n=1 Tax=Mucilaginibacter agri TaxID=2695265 RepID=A0A966DWE9_9SPHI|nr:RNA-binding protein [Mucilaginibacter agri]NCD72461.1 RNA-binding protein [Mucilaginibacter agri]